MKAAGCASHTPASNTRDAPSDCLNKKISELSDIDEPWAKGLTVTLKNTRAKIIEGIDLKN